MNFRLICCFYLLLMSTFSYGALSEFSVKNPVEDLLSDSLFLTKIIYKRVGENPCFLDTITDELRPSFLKILPENVMSSVYISDSIPLCSQKYQSELADISRRVYFEEVPIQTAMAVSIPLLMIGGTVISGLLSCSIRFASTPARRQYESKGVSDKIKYYANEIISIGASAAFGLSTGMAVVRHFPSPLSPIVAASFFGVFMCEADGYYIGYVMESNHEEKVSKPLNLEREWVQKSGHLQ